MICCDNKMDNNNNNIYSKITEGDNDKHVGSMMIMRNSKGGNDWLIL